MGIVSDLFQQRSGLDPSRSGLWATLGGLGGTSAGVAVGQANALSLSAVWACVRVLAESVAQLPLITYQQDGRGKERATDHNLYNLLKLAPNPEMTSFELRETMMGHVATWGNAYAEIEWDNAGQVAALWPLRPDSVEIKRVGGDLFYDVLVGNAFERLPAWRVLHLRGLSFSGLVGYSPIRLHAETLGYSFATKEYGARYFGNGARPGVVLKYPGRLDDEMLERLRASWNSADSGLANAHRTKILEDGMDLETVGIPPEESQFLETQKYQVTDIARIFRIQPHKIGILDNAIQSNIEEQAMEFVTDTLAPWLIRWEQSMHRSLLVGAEKERFFFSFILDGLLRGNTEARYSAHATAIQNGFLSPNEVREKENLNPYDGGDTFLLPLNMIDAAAGPDPAVGSASTRSTCSCGCQGRQDGYHAIRVVADPDSPQLPYRTVMRIGMRNDDSEQQAQMDGRQALARAHLRLFEDAAGRVVRREVADLRRALNNKTLAAFMADLDDFFEDLRGAMPSYFRAILQALAEQVATAVGAELGADGQPVDDAFIDEYLAAYAGGYVASHNRQLQALVDLADDEDGATQLVAERLDAWQETQPAKEAQQQAFEATNALAVAAYVAGGVQLLRWMAQGESCPFCRSLSGKVVGVNNFFVMGGESITVGDDAMQVRRNRRHGPIHRGCDCVVIAA